MQVLVAVGEKAYLQAFDQLLDVVSVANQGRHHH